MLDLAALWTDTGHADTGGWSPAPAPKDKETGAEKPNEGDSPTLLNRIRRPKDKGKSNLFNPDDEDYL